MNAHFSTPGQRRLGPPVRAGSPARGARGCTAGAPCAAPARAPCAAPARAPCAAPARAPCAAPTRTPCAAPARAPCAAPARSSAPARAQCGVRAPPPRYSAPRPISSGPVRGCANSDQVVTAGMGRSVTSALQAARQTGNLKLQGRGLVALPPECFAIGDVVLPESTKWWEMRNTLDTFDVSQNELEELSDAIAEYPELREVTLSHNRLGTLPSAACWANMEALVSLVASHNQLAVMPDGFGAGNQPPLARLVRRRHPVSPFAYTGRTCALAIGAGALRKPAAPAAREHRGPGASCVTRPVAQPVGCAARRDQPPFRAPAPAALTQPPCRAARRARARAAPLHRDDRAQREPAYEAVAGLSCACDPTGAHHIHRAFDALAHGATRAQCYARSMPRALDATRARCRA